MRRLKGFSEFRFRQWRKYSGLWPIGEIHRRILAKVQWIFAIGECLVGKSFIGEIQESHLTLQVSPKEFWFQP